VSSTRSPVRHDPEEATASNAAGSGGTAVEVAHAKHQTTQIEATDRSVVVSKMSPPVEEASSASPIGESFDRRHLFENASNAQALVARSIHPILRELRAPEPGQACAGCGVDP
jgi:hypothetical protein